MSWTDHIRKTLAAVLAIAVIVCNRVFNWGLTPQDLALAAGIIAVFIGGLAAYDYAQAKNGSNDMLE